MIELIQLLNKGIIMLMTKTTPEVNEYLLTLNDRCDRCNAQAYVKAVGLDGDLLFCAHHYNKIVDNAVGYDKIMKFAINIVDERDRLIENKLKGQG
jgi:hypothetical protein